MRFTDVGPTPEDLSGPRRDHSRHRGHAEVDPRPRRADRRTAGADSATPDPRALIGRAQQLGFPRISIDQRTNSVVIHGTPEAIASIEKSHPRARPAAADGRDRSGHRHRRGGRRPRARHQLARLAGPEASGDPRSVAIDTGTNGGQVDNPPLGGDLFSSNGLNALSLLPNASTAGATVASFVVRGAEGILQAQLQALATDDRARVLSAPRLVTLDNITARITRSQNIYVQVDTRNEEGGGLGAVGLQEIQTGLTLEITPSIVPSQTDQSAGFVRLNLRAENSAPGTGVFGQIDVRSQEVQTNVLVPDGATFVIGGLVRRHPDRDRSRCARAQGHPAAGSAVQEHQHDEEPRRDHLLHHAARGGRAHGPAERHRREGRIRGIYPPRAADARRRLRRFQHAHARLAHRGRCPPWKKTNDGTRGRARRSLPSFSVARSSWPARRFSLAPTGRTMSTRRRSARSRMPCARCATGRSSCARARVASCLSPQATSRAIPRCLACPGATFPRRLFNSTPSRCRRGICRLRALPRAERVAALEIRPRSYVTELSPGGEIVRAGWIPEGA